MFHMRNFNRGVLLAIACSAASARAGDREDERAAVVDAAQARGFESVDFSAGLQETLRDITSGDTTVEIAKKRLIKLSALDYYEFRVQQVLTQDKALIKSQWMPLLLINNRKNGGAATLVEEMTLKALGFEYFAIRGTQDYVAAIGSRRQAIVIEPINLDAAPKDERDPAKMAAELKHLANLSKSEGCQKFYRENEQCMLTLLDDEIRNYAAENDSLVGRMPENLQPAPLRKIRGLKFLSATTIPEACIAKANTQENGRCLMALMVSASTLMDRALQHRLDEIAAFRDREGFESVPWGATPDEVRAAFSKARGQSDVLQAKLNVVDRNANVRFRLPMSKLVEVEAEFSKAKEPLVAFEEVNISLREKYGDPLEESDATPASRRAMWKTERTVIEHTIVAKTGKHLLTYRSVELAALGTSLAKGK